MVNSLVKGCRIWDRLTEKMNDGGYPVPALLKSYKLSNGGYQELDYDHLRCRITGKLAEVQVGDAEDHKTKINLAEHTLSYHDPDDPTNLGVAELFRSLGLRCNVIENRGVNCRGVTPAKSLMVFRALVMIPSMDRRMEECRGKGRSGAECRKLEIKWFEETAKRDK